MHNMLLFKVSFSADVADEHLVAVDFQEASLAAINLARSRITFVNAVEFIREVLVVRSV